MLVAVVGTGRVEGPGGGGGGDGDGDEDFTSLC